jgi:MFS family permease
MGSTQILGFGTTYYLPAVLAAPISRDTGWGLGSVVAGLSLGFLVAGFGSPRVGRLIDRFGGRPILCGSSLLFAAGLFLMGVASSLFLYYLAWSLLGLGMAAGLYEAAFATLARLYGEHARSAMTGLTLIGGFASTLGWPLISGLESQFGWRDSCFLLAGVHLLVGLPLQWLGIPREERMPGVDRKIPAARGNPQHATSRLLILVGVLFTLQSLVASSLSVHLLDILRQLGIAAATALAIGMLLGPSQVVARLAEFSFGRLLHPTWSTRIGVLLCLLGIALLVPAVPALAFVAMALYGAGNGILTVARGTLPLALFGREGYGERMGLLARPMLLAQACGPILVAVVLDRFGASSTLIILCTLIAAGCLASGYLPSRRASGDPPSR